jgi:hypothetical protein
MSAMPPLLIPSPMPVMLARAVPQRVEIAPLVEGGGAAPVTAATVALYGPDGAEVIAPTACTVSGGTVAATLTVPASARYDDRYYLVWALTITGYVTPWQHRDEAQVVRYRLSCPISHEDIVRLAPAIDATRRGAVTRTESYDGQIREAWNQIQTRLLQHGNRPNLIVSASALRTACLDLTLHLIYAMLASQQSNPAYDDARDRHWMRYDEEMGRVKLTWAADDGDVELTRRNAQPGSFWLGGAGGARRGETRRREVGTILPRVLP